MNKKANLSEDIINEFVSSNPPWVFRENSLEASFEFADFEDAMRVVNLVAEKAGELNHHPFWSNEYNKLAFVLSTHDEGNIVTQLDLDLAQAISKIIKG